MREYIRTVKTASGATAVQIERKDGRRRVGIEHIGSAHTEAELKALKAEARRRMNEGQMSLDLFPGEAPAVHTVASESRLLWEALSRVWRGLGLDELCDPTFRAVCLARVVEPVSKLDTPRVLRGLGVEPPTYDMIRGCLARCATGDYRERVQRSLLSRAPEGSLTLLLYDVTTLFFEIQREDDYRKPGLSKERRLEPQITVGLLTGRDGFPLEVQSFEGNRAEVRTVMEVLGSFRERYGDGPLTVTADAAMLSSKNIAELEAAGFDYIIGNRLSKCPYEIAELELATGEPPADGQTFDLEREFTIDGKKVKRRVVYQYREKRARMDLRNIERAVEKAERMASGKAPYKRNRFLEVKGADREVNWALVESARLRAGVKGYVTSLSKAEATPLEVVEAYHRLFEVEASFRMSKSDLKARPIYHHKRESIEAHLTVVLAALAVSREIRRRTGLSIRRIRHLLEPLRTSVISVNGVRMEAPPIVSAEARAVLDALGMQGE